MNLFQSLKRNVREYFEHYPLASCGLWGAAAVAFFVLLLVLPPEVVDLLWFIFSLISLCGPLFEGE